MGLILIAGLCNFLEEDFDFIIDSCLEMSEERDERLKKIKLKKRKRKGFRR